jgi:hypothetical protein
VTVLIARAHRLAELGQAALTRRVELVEGLSELPPMCMVPEDIDLIRQLVDDLAFAVGVVAMGPT